MSTPTTPTPNRAPSRRQAEAAIRLLWLIAILSPLALLFLAPARAPGPLAALFWIVLLGCALVIYWLMGFAMDETPLQLERRPIAPAERPPVVDEVLDVESATQHGGVQVFRGRLRGPSPDAYAKLKASLSDRWLPLLEEDEQHGAAVLLVPRKSAPERPLRLWVHVLLFVLTVVTTTFAGAAHQGVDLLREPGRFAVGLPYAIGLLAILGIHEIGHYVAGRRHGLQVTLPYFIPVPFALGTFGAFIQMRSPSDNRRVLFDGAIWGPLAGLAVAIVALLLGLQGSAVLPGSQAVPPQMGGGTSVGSSILLALIAKASLGDALEYGHVLRLSPVAFAGWLGMFITALNLLPIGQLDGGHVARALLGRRVGDTVSTVAVWSLLLLSLFVWPGLMLWALIALFVAGRGQPPLDDITPLPPLRRWVGYATFVVAALILAPLPHSLWPAAGIHCPYL